MSVLAGVNGIESRFNSDDEDIDDYYETTEERNRSDTSFMCPETYMSMVWHGGHLGIAYYDLSSLQIHVMADNFENDEFSLVKQIVREAQPRVIVLSSLQDSRLLACVKKLVSDRSPVSPRYNEETCRLEFLPNSDFSYEVSKRRILLTKLPSVPSHFTEEERKLYFASLISFDNTNMIRSVGGLLKYLEKTRVGVELEDISTHVPVIGFKAFTVENLIHIDAMTYCALNIFHIELHPSAYKFGFSSSKEGLSLFGILNKCKSAIGRKMLRQWFLRPVKNASLLRQRYDAVSFLMKPSNLEVVNCLQGCLKHIKFIPKILMRMSKAQATIGDWIALYKTLFHAVYIGDISRAQTGDVEIFRKIGATFTDDLHRCTNLICKTIDFEESKQLKRFVVQPNIDEALDDKKRTFNGLPDLLSQVAQKELDSLSAGIPECVVSYLPQVGYLLVIEMPEGKSEEDDHTIEGLQFKFASNNQLFYKSAKTLELDDLLGDIQLEILDMEVNIMHRLQAAILENTHVMLNLMEMAAELDCLLAFASAASEFVYVRPSLIEEDIIEIKAGRHPLQELCCSMYVPNHTIMGGSQSKMKLLTGPNACGKSVYLKQVALIIYMAHIGSFVPAEVASIGPVDRIFSRIKSMESVSGGMSTFMQDNMQIAEALQSATSNSLVIVDEFGKGTESTDGLALLTAVLKHWIAKGPACPFVLVSTHFHSIIQQRLLPNTVHLQYLTLETVMNGEELVFLYQLKEGHTSSSYAGNIATQVGMPTAIIRRGHQVSDLLSRGHPVPHMNDSNTKLQNKLHERIVEAFLNLNLETDDLNAFLKGFVLQVCADHQNMEQSSQDPEQPQCAPQISSTSKRAPQCSDIATATISKESTSSSEKVKESESLSILSIKKKTGLKVGNGAILEERTTKESISRSNNRDDSGSSSSNFIKGPYTSSPSKNPRRPIGIETFHKTPVFGKNQKLIVGDDSCTQRKDQTTEERVNFNTPQIHLMQTSSNAVKTEESGKRKIDMGFLFSSLPKKATWTSHEHNFEKNKIDSGLELHSRTFTLTTTAMKHEKLCKTPTDYCTPGSSTVFPNSDTSSNDKQSKFSPLLPRNKKKTESEVGSPFLTPMTERKSGTNSSESVLSDNEVHVKDQPHGRGHFQTFERERKPDIDISATPTAIDTAEKATKTCPFTTGSSTAIPESTSDENLMIEKRQTSSVGLSTSS